MNLPKTTQYVVPFQKYVGYTCIRKLLVQCCKEIDWNFHQIEPLKYQWFILINFSEKMEHYKKFTGIFAIIMIIY